jgi:hypothetical protein
MMSSLQSLDFRACLSMVCRKLLAGDHPGGSPRRFGLFARATVAKELSIDIFRKRACRHLRILIRTFFFQCANLGRKSTAHAAQLEKGAVTLLYLTSCTIIDDGNVENFCIAVKYTEQNTVKKSINF